LFLFFSWTMLIGMMDHRTKFRIKAWSVRILFVVTFFCLPLIPIRLGYGWPLVAMLPGALVMLFLWPSVLADTELTPSRLRNTRAMSVAVLAVCAGVCVLLSLYA
jgi:hypothetical protein